MVVDYGTKSEAKEALKRLKENGELRLREILGEFEYSTLEVRKIECYENGDAKGIYIHDE